MTGRLKKGTASGERTQPKGRGVLFFAPPYKDLGGEESIARENPPPPVPLGIASVFSYVSAKSKIPCDFYYSIDYSEAAVRKVLCQQRPLIVAVSCFSFNRFACLDIARIAKEIDPLTAIVFGGPHTMFLDEQLLLHYPCVDYVIRGEGEKTFYELAQALYYQNDVGSVAGISFRQKGGVVRTKTRPRVESLDDLPLIDYSKVILKEGLFKTGREWAGASFPVETSRGCPFGCSFCSTVGLWGRRVTYRSIERVLEQIELIPKLSGRWIFFNDMNFTLDLSYAESLCRALIKRRIKIPWACSTRFDLINEKTLRLMKKAGCSVIFFGAESFSETVLKKAGKEYDFHQAIRNVNLASDIGLNVHLAFILGLPGETRGTLAETLRICKGIEARCSVTINFPPELFPGSDLYRRALEEGFDESYWLKAHKGDNPYYEKALSASDLESWEKVFRSRFSDHHKKEA